MKFLVLFGVLVLSGKVAERVVVVNNRITTNSDSISVKKVKSVYVVKSLK